MFFIFGLCRSSDHFKHTFLSSSDGYLILCHSLVEIKSGYLQKYMNTQKGLNCIFEKWIFFSKSDIKVCILPKVYFEKL